MNYKRFHLLEKTQVLLAGGGLLAVIYFFGAGGAFRPADPLGPIVLIPEGRWASLLLAGAMLLGLSVLTAAATTHSRPEGGLLTALVAMGGLSLRSAPMDSLLWRWDADRGGLYGGLILEVLLLAAAVMLAEGLVMLLRTTLARRRPAWVWSDPLDTLTESQRKILRASRTPLRGDAERVRSAGHMPHTLLGDLGGWWWGGRAGSKEFRADRRRQRGRAFRDGAACLAMGAAGGIFLTTLLMQSDLRGQILFSLAAAFALAALAARHVFPTRSMYVAWLMPVVAAMVFYLLAALTRGEVRPPYLALPLDWITAGCGGSLLGFWVAGRMQESRVFETLDRQRQKGAAEGSLVP